jgi:hypothetical protein
MTRNAHGDSEMTLHTMRGGNGEYIFTADI